MREAPTLGSAACAAAAPLRIRQHEAAVNRLDAGPPGQCHRVDKLLPQHVQHGDQGLFPPVQADRLLEDGDTVTLGGSTLTARLTPGHTAGCTTWTMEVKDGSRTRDVVIVGSPNVNPGYKLVDNNVYPKMAGDFEKTFAVLKSLPVDYFLGAHGSYFDMESKYAKLKAEGSAVFIDPEGYKNYVADREQAFRRELGKQKSEAK